MEKASLQKSKLLVVKVGSRLVATETSIARKEWMASLAADIAALTQNGTQVVLVSSGAVALGRATLKLGTGALPLAEKQAAASAGQPLLMQAWAEAFTSQAIDVAQVLVTLEDTEERHRYLNARTTLQHLLQHKLVPIVNENDTVATAEIKFGDNDRLAAKVAAMLGADTLILLSDIDGLYDKNPSQHKDAKHIAVIETITKEIEAMGGGAASAFSNGGMITKIEAAKIATASGCSVVIAKGEALHPLRAIIEGAKHSTFVASESPINARKHWIQSALHLPGAIVVDAGAKIALSQGKSLLPAGVIAAKGSFDRGDTIGVELQDGTLIAKGISAYHASEVTKIMGKKSGDIAAILGYAGDDTVIHRDDLVMVV
ncbi:MAG: glutamate 5-kinase [Alphaproteobacteria bacterium]|nr:glutamate 5-kinase [Alphaproteobacteria bacterium]